MQRNLLRSFLGTLFSIIFALFTAFSLSSAAHANELTIEASQVRVLEEPSNDADEMATLEKGDTVQVSKKGPVGGFLKVLVETNGRKRIGYIRVADLKARGGQKVSRRGLRRVPRSYFSRYGIGAILGLNYSTQGARRIESTDDPPGSPVDVSSLSGLSTQYGFLVDFPISKTMAGRGYLLFKQMNVTGSATLRSINPKPVDAFVSQTFLSIGGTWKYYGLPPSFTWWGAGLQIDKGLSGTIKYGTLSTAVDSSYLPTFIFPYLAGGIDWMISRDWSLLPELRLGAITNTKPMIFEADFNLGVAYSF